METKRVQEVVRGLRQKPQHVRENMAVGVAGGATLLVAFGWFVAMSVSGSFSLAPSSVIASKAAPPVAATKDSFSNLLGAAGAAFSGSTTPAQVTIVDNPAPSEPNQTVDPNTATVIHF